MTWFDDFRAKALADDDIKILADGVTVKEFRGGFVPVLVEQISPSGSTVYSDIYDSSGNPMSGSKIEFDRGDDTHIVDADKPHDHEPMSTFIMFWARDGWNCWIDNNLTTDVIGLDYRRSYYIVWKWAERDIEPLPLQAQFLAEPQSATVPFEVKLLNKSIGNIDRYEWKLNGNQFSTQQNPTVEILTAGLHTISLTIHNGDDSDTESIEVTGLKEGNVVGAIEHQHNKPGRGAIDPGEIYASKSDDWFGATMLGLEIEAMEQAIIKAKAQNRTFLTFYVKISKLSDIEVRYQDDTPGAN